MTNRISYVLLGFVIGVISTLLFAIFYASNESEDTESAKLDLMDSLATLDKLACPNYPYDILVGNWVGETQIDENGNQTKWVVQRNQDGTYKIDFEFITNNDTSYSSEEGYWSYSGCLYSVIVNSVNGKKALYQEIYRVHEIKNYVMAYTNYRTGKNYTVTKEF